MKRRPFVINSLLVTAASMGILKGTELPKAEPVIPNVKELISFEEFFLMANGFEMNSYQTLYYEEYSNNHSSLGSKCSYIAVQNTKIILGVRQQGMSTLMNTIALYEQKVMRKSIVMIPWN